MMTSAHCSTLDRTERAFPVASAELRAHLAACGVCNARWSELDELAQLGREIPVRALGEDRRDAMRDAILARVSAKPEPRSRARWRPERRVFWMAAAALLLAVAGIFIGLTRGNGDAGAPQIVRAKDAHKGAVHTHGDARFVRVGKAGDEVVRLIDGTITVEVQPLAKGERFRVVTGDAEVEVRGTAFDVVAEGDHLKSVRVLHGKVEVRPEDGPIRMLGPAERWEASPRDAAREPRPEAAPGEEAQRADAAAVEAMKTAVLPRSPRVAPEPGAPTKPVGPAREVRGQRPRELVAVHRTPPITTRLGHPREASRRAPVVADASEVDPEADAGATAEEDVAPTPREPLPVEASYQRGWDALRAGRAEDAATEFAAVLAADPSGGLAEDAGYWRAVALGRADGRRAEAIMAFRAFLRAHPEAVRGAEASVMLGWLLIEEGSLERAQTRFESAAEAQDPAVRDSSRRGLSEVARRRAERVLPTP